MDVDCFMPNCSAKHKGKLNINFEKNCFKCNYCGAHGGMLDLYAFYCNISRSDANREITEALHSGKMAEIRKSQPKVELVPQSAAVNYENRHQTYAMLSELLRLSEANRKQLLDRGLTAEQIQKQGYRSTPAFGCLKLTNELMKRGCHVEGIPGFYVDKSGRWTMKFSSYCSGILIPYMSLEQKIQGYQIRLDKPFADENGKMTKYIWFSSVNERMGASSGSPVHFIGNPGDSIVYFTEGALKSNIAHSLSGKSFLAVAGTGCFGNVESTLKKLKMLGTHTIVEAYDSDKYSNEKVMRDRNTLMELVRRCGLAVKPIRWDKQYKGVDDYLMALKTKPNGGD